MTVGPWVDKAFVGILPDFSRFMRELDSGITRSLSGLTQSVGRITDRIERNFDELARSANSSLADIGDRTSFTGLEQRARSAGEGVERAFDEAQRGVEESLRGVGGTTAFSGIKGQAERAAEGVERSFEEAQHGADDSLSDIGGPGQFTGIRTQAKIAAQGIERDFNHASVSARASLGGLRVVGFGAASVLVGAFGLMGAAAAKMGIQAAAASEQAEISFGQLLGSGQKAKAFLADLNQFAATTPFELPGLIDAARSLLGVGQRAKDVIPIMSALGNATGALGLSQEAFGRIMLATTQAMSKGKLQGEELMQMQEAGLPITKLLAEALGVTTAQISEMSQKGELVSDKVFPRLFAQMQKDYGGAMIKQSRTLNGLWSTLMDTIRNGLKDVLLPLAPFLKDTMAGAITTLGGAFKDLPGHIQGAIDKLGELRQTRIGVIVVGGGQAIIDQIRDALKDGNWNAVARVTKEALTQAVEWAAGESANALIDGLAEGLRTGDWSDLGHAIGEHMSAVPLAITEGLRKIEWRNVGHQAALILVPFALGLAGGLFDGIVEAFREDFWATLIDIAMIIPLGRAAGILGRTIPALLRVPFLGGFLRVFEGAGKFLEAPIRAFTKRFGDDIIEGIGRVFPGIGRFLERSLGRGGVLDHLRLVAGEWREAGLRLIGRLVGGITEQFALVVRNVGRVIQLLTRPFVGSGRWLLREGGDLLRGLLTGLRGLWGDVSLNIRFTIRRLLDPFRGIGRWLLREGGDLLRGLLTGLRGLWGDVSLNIRFTIRRLLDPFRGIIRWLLREGGDLLRGLGSGIRGLWGALSGWIRTTISRITSPFRTAFSFLTSAGQNILRGLIDGMRRGLSAIGGILSDIKNAIVGGIRRLFGIRSPSAVMAGLGVNMIAGLVRGLLGSQSGLQGVVRNLGVSTANLLGSVLGGIWERVKGGWQKAVSFIGGITSAVGGSVASIVQRMAASVGWTGAQWSALQQLIMHESGFNPNAQNPTSSAYGLFQFLDSTWASVGAHKTSDPAAQTAAGLRYIASRYGSPIGAWNFWQGHHWYHQGGPILEDIVGVGPSGRTYGFQAGERVVARDQQATVVNIQAGAVQISVQGPVSPAMLPRITSSVEDGLHAVLRELRTGTAA